MYKCRCWLFFAVIALLFSCATTKENDKIDDFFVAENIEDEFENTENIENENTETYDFEILNSQEIIEEVVEETVSEEELYLNSLNDVKLVLKSSPKEIKKGNKFSEPFVIFVCDNEENPIADFNVTVKFPKSRINDDITFETIALKTDENGLISYMPDNTNFSVKTKVVFSPEIYETENEIVKTSLLEKIQEMEIYADYSVKTQLNSAVLFVWDYNELNKPMGNSYELISTLRSNGMWNVGNAPVNDVSDIGKPVDYIYNANYEIIGKSFEYLIGGTIKFTKKVEKVETGYEAALIADIYVIDMKNGKEIYKTIVENSAIGDNWNKAVGKSRDEISDKILQSLFYGL